MAAISDPSQAYVCMCASIPLVLLPWLQWGLLAPMAILALPLAPDTSTCTRLRYGHLRDLDNQEKQVLIRVHNSRIIIHGGTTSHRPPIPRHRH
ncbi:hypothetical protein K438DRAFT_1795382 [Mycena galopus ATCC 62051]|nr:hypothetical protein K438DRAFT_1795382 [Mycena galopus ATCC 62051]